MISVDRLKEELGAPGVLNAFILYIYAGTVEKWEMIGET